MDFHEEPVDTGAGCRAGERLDELALAAGLRAAPAWQLHAMGGVEDHRITETP